jgi:hypothetical protein
MVLAEDLAEKAPDGRDGAEQAIAIRDAVLVESSEDAELAQSVGKGESLVAREAVVDLLQAGHGGTSSVRGCNAGRGWRRRPSVSRQHPTAGGVNERRGDRA